VLRGHAQRIHSVAFDDAGARLLTTSIDHTVRLWNVADGSTGPILLGHQSPSWAASFIKGAATQEQSVLSVGMDDRVRWWGLDSGTPMFSTTIDECDGRIAHLEFTPDQSKLTALGENAYAEITLDPTPRLSRERRVAGATQKAVPALQLVIGTAKPSGIFAQRVDSGERIWSASCEPFRDGFFVSSSGEQIAVSQKTNILLLNARDGVDLGSINTVYTAQSVVFSRDETLLASQSFKGEVSIGETKTGKLVEQLTPIADRCFGLAWNTDASRIIYCHAMDGVAIWDRNARRIITRIDSVGGYVWSLALSPDGKRLAAGAQDRVCHIYDIPSGDEVLQLRERVGSVMSVVWSLDGRTLPSGGYDRKVVVRRAPVAK